MGVVMNRLTDIKIKKISQKGRYPDGLGLFLNIGKTQNKNWTFKYTINYKSHEMGLGPYPLISLKDTRNKRDDLLEKRYLIMQDWAKYIMDIIYK